MGSLIRSINFLHTFTYILPENLRPFPEQRMVCSNRCFQLALSLSLDDLAFLNNCDDTTTYTIFAPGNNNIV